MWRHSCLTSFVSTCSTDTLLYSSTVVPGWRDVHTLAACRAVHAYSKEYVPMIPLYMPRRTKYRYVPWLGQKFLLRTRSCTVLNLCIRQLLSKRRLRRRNRTQGNTYGRPAGQQIKVTLALRPSLHCAVLLYYYMCAAAVLYCCVLYTNTAVLQALLCCC